MATNSSPIPTVSETRTFGARRRSRLPALALGAVLAGLVAASASAGTPAVATSDQQIGDALRAATTARAAYTIYYAAAIDDCSSVVQGCGSALAEGPGVGDSGLESAALLLPAGGAAAQTSNRP